MKSRNCCIALAALLVFLLSSLSYAQDASAQKVPLTFEAFTRRLVTPASAATAGSRRYHFRATNASGTLRIAGKSVPVKVRKKGSSYYFALDSNGDGTIGSNEYRKIALRGGKAATMLVKVKIDGEVTPVIITDLTVSTTKGQTSAYGNCFAGGCRKGAFGGVTIRLIDDNLDGRFTQDGKDAVAIGQRPRGALPLMKIHRIGTKLFRLNVSAEGDSVELAPVSGVELGRVKVPINSSILKSLVLVSKDAGFACDISASAEGIPAGQYQLSYGIIGDTRSSLMMAPGTRPLSYSVQAGKINTLRIGKPIRADFGVQLAGNKINVGPPVLVTGAGGEVYAPITFGSGGNGGTPALLLSMGGRQQSAKMKFG